MGLGAHVPGPADALVDDLHRARVEIAVPRNRRGVEEASEVPEARVEHLGEVRLVFRDPVVEVGHRGGNVLHRPVVQRLEDDDLLGRELRLRADQRVRLLVARLAPQAGDAQVHHLVVACCRGRSSRPAAIVWRPFDMSPFG